MNIEQFTKKIISCFLTASFILMPLVSIMQEPVYAQTYDFEEIYDFNNYEDITEVYDYNHVPEMNKPEQESVTKPKNNTQTTIYDFSDEAQNAFDNNEKATQLQQPIDYTVEKQKKKTKTKNKKKNSMYGITQPEIHQNTITPNKQDSKTTYTQQNEHIEITQPQQLNSSNNLLKGSVVYVPAGSSFQAILQSSISSASLTENDTIAAVLQDDWYSNGVLIAPMGSIVYGKTVDAEKAGLAYGNGSFSITFTEILTPKGDQLLLTTNVVTVEVESQRTKRIATNIVGSALVGALAGLVRALIVGGDITDGLAVGSGVGAVYGAARVVFKKGEEVEVPAGTVINVRLTKQMNAQPYEEDEYYTD